MSSTAVPCPGSSGRSTVNPAFPNATASGRIDCGLPVKPWRTSAPWDPPSDDHGSAPDMIGAVMVRHAIGDTDGVRAAMGSSIGAALWLPGRRDHVLIGKEQLTHGHTSFSQRRMAHRGSEYPGRIRRQGGADSPLGKDEPGDHRGSLWRTYRLCPHGHHVGPT